MELHTYVTLIIAFIIVFAIVYLIMPYTWRCLVRLRIGLNCAPKIGFLTKFIASFFVSLGLAFISTILYLSIKDYGGFYLIDHYDKIYFVIPVAISLLSYICTLLCFVYPFYRSYSKKQIDDLKVYGTPEYYFVLDFTPKDNLIIMPNHICIFEHIFERCNLIGIHSNIHSETYEYQNKKESIFYGNVTLTFTDMEALIDGEKAKMCGTDLSLMVSKLERIVKENNGNIVNRKTILNEDKKARNTSSVKFISR